MPAKSSPERGCVGVEGHQPQHSSNFRALRLVFDTAALREDDFVNGLELATRLTAKLFESGAESRNPLERCDKHTFTTSMTQSFNLAARLAFGLALSLAGRTAILSAAEAESKPAPVISTNGPILVHPIHHATCVMIWKERTIYVDPVGSVQRYGGLPKPDLILITELHDDHFDTNTLAGLLRENTRIIAPSAVVEKLSEPLKKQTIEMSNGGTEILAEIRVEAIPMYNLAADKAELHSKGRGNGYLVTLGGKRVYFSGATEDIPEMRALTDIDLAFISMSVPDTMSVDQAASAVREFKPRIVCPYHCRGSDLERFKQLVGSENGIEVVLREWYRFEKAAAP